MHKLNILDSKILIIDDEPVNTTVLEALFDSKNFTNILAITDPVEGVKLYRENDIDLVLLDINMPVLNGFDVMDEFNLIEKSIPPPILILTAQHDNDTRMRALNGGASDFITKPFSMDEVLSRSNNLLDMHLGHKTLATFNHELEIKVEERTQQLALSQKEALDCLSYAAEYKDMDTAQHTIRVGWYSRLLGEKIGVSGEELEILFQASPMHDVGKIGIPDKILLKPGKFEPDEWAIMQTHSEIGANILQGNSSPLMIAAKEIALCHHEKWDGSGYPNNLAGNDIPINARIVILADIFDALTIERPYKKPWTLEKTVEYIMAESGNFFEPDIVKAFSEVQTDFVDIMQRFKG